MFQTDKDNSSVTADLSACAYFLPSSNQLSEVSGHPKQDECLELIKEWEQLTLEDIDPMEHAWRCAFREAKRFAQAGDQATAAQILARSCVYPNAHRSHFNLLFRLWRCKNTEDKKIRRYEEVKNRVLAMMRKDEDLVRSLVLIFAETHGDDGSVETFERFRNLRLQDMKALLCAALALGDVSRASLAREWIRCHARKRWQKPR